MNNIDNLINMMINKCPNSPMKDNLNRMIQNKDYYSIEQMARNLCKEHGVDPDVMFNNTKKQYENK